MEIEKTATGGEFMNKALYSRPLSLRAIQMTDPFWKEEMELVRREVLPYQWAALNDAVAVSYTHLDVYKRQTMTLWRSKRTEKL